ncbi:MAG: ABC transporter permease [Barnesiella sp.]|nr:ABC transporter permease [Barnesiella sp.]
MSNPVFDIDNWREIGATLAQNKTRTLMTAFGIFWGTAILAILIGGADGFRNFMGMKFQGFATNMGLLWPNRTTKPYAGFNKGRTFNFSVKDAEQIRNSVDGIDAFSVANNFGATAMYGTRSSSVTFTGVQSDYSHIIIPVIYEGRFLNASDDAMGRKVCVIGKRVAGDLFGVGSAVGKEISVNGIYYKVVGVAGQSSSDVSIMGTIDDSVIISNDNLRRSYNMGDNVGFIMFTAKPGFTPSQLKDDMMRIVSRNHLIAPDDTGAVYMFDVSEQFAMLDNLMLGINLLALFVGLGTLLSGVVGVGNIMWIIVRERTQEIGIRRAIGAKPRDIVMQILSEGIVLTLVAGLAGITFAAIVLGVVQMVLAPVHFQMSFATAITILAAFIVLGTLAGLVPSLKAMRIKPIEALNSK